MRISDMQDLNIIIPKIYNELKNIRDNNNIPFETYLEQIKAEGTIVKYVIGEAQSYVDLWMPHVSAIHRLPLKK